MLHRPDTAAPKASMLRGRTDQEATLATEARQRPFFTNEGPLNGLVLHREASPTLRVYAADPAGPFPIGIAFSVGSIAGRDGLVAIFRLAIGGVIVEGDWICRGRQFTRFR